MTADIPAIRLGNLVSLLTGTRALGPAARVRDGSMPYSTELDFMTTDLRAVRQTIAWARDQAPYAQIELASGAETGLVTIFARVDAPRLARYLAERALLHATGELWDPANDPLAALVQHVITGTIGSGEDWPDMLSEITGVAAALAVIQETLAKGDLPAPKAQRTATPRRGGG